MDSSRAATRPSDRRVEPRHPGVRQARRVAKARRLIRQAYGLDPRKDADRILRVELLGEHVALVRVRANEPDAPPLLWLAQELSTGRVVRLRRENREHLASVSEMFKVLESLYAVYGGPNGEPPSQTAQTTAPRR